MIQVLIVDDEKLEREGIKYLLAMEEGEWNIREASNGRGGCREIPIFSS